MSVQSGALTADPLGAARRRLKLPVARFGLLWLAPTGFVLLVFYLIPLGKLLTRGFYADGFTLAHFRHLWSEPLYATGLLATVRVSLIVTACTIILGYPVAYFLRQVGHLWRQIAIVFVLLPFWTSVLVRSYAWIALLSRGGIINKSLREAGVIEQPLQLMYNETGVVIGMTYVLLPMMILTLLASMHTIDMRLIVASHSLGAGRLQTFWRVFFPLSLPGLWAGSLLVFITALGFFVTPALLGGGRVPLVSMLIESQMHGVLNWGLGAAISTVLLLIVLFTYYLLDRAIGVERLLVRS
jgi:putative spermidine/putrescine transport system permease protein